MASARVMTRAVLAMAVLVAGLAQAQISDINAAINKAGRQRMLSQRMAKAYMQLALNVDAEKSKRILKQSQALFEVQLEELTAYAPNSQILETYQKLENLWTEYQALLGEKPTVAGAKKVLEQSDKVLAVAHDGTVQLEKVSGKAQGRLVNVAGRQRMLSQRLAKFYQATALGSAAENTPGLMNTAREDFEKGLAELTNSPLNTPQLKAKLDMAAQYWTFFSESLTIKQQIPKQESAIVAQVSERMLELMDEVTGMYEVLSTARAAAESGAGGAGGQTGGR